MDERAGGEPGQDFLPPEPIGPEPDLGTGSPREHDAPVHHGFLPPRRAAAHAHAPATDQVGPPPVQLGPSPPSAGWQGQPAQWTYAGAPAAPDNGDALAGLILSVSAAALLLLSVGMSTIISVVCAALGIYYSRKGRARVDRGETPRRRGLAQAGLVTGIVTVVLSILATIFWVALLILYATDEDFRHDLQGEPDGGDGPPDGFRAAIPVALQALRIVALLLR